MNIKNIVEPPAPESGAISPAIKRPRTRSQVRASAIADGLAAKDKWKTLIGEARAAWEKVSSDDLAKVDGDFHRLAGLIQLRYQISREESDRQARDFFDRHYSVA